VEHKLLTICIDDDTFHVAVCCIEMDGVPRELTLSDWAYLVLEYPTSTSSCLCVQNTSLHVQPRVHASRLVPDTKNAKTQQRNCQRLFSNFYLRLVWKLSIAYALRVTAVLDGEMRCTAACTAPQHPSHSTLHTHTHNHVLANITPH
jgi:hypothetical protein